MKQLEFYYGNIYVCLDNTKVENKPTIIEDYSVYPFKDETKIMMNICQFKEKNEIRKTALLIKVKEGIYVDVDDISNLLDLNMSSINPDKFLTKHKEQGKRIITTFPICYGNLFVNEEELVSVPCSITKGKVFKKRK